MKDVIEEYISWTSSDRLAFRNRCPIHDSAPNNTHTCLWFSTDFASDSRQLYRSSIACVFPEGWKVLKTKFFILNVKVRSKARVHMGVKTVDKLSTVQIEPSRSWRSLGNKVSGSTTGSTPASCCAEWRQEVHAVRCSVDRKWTGNFCPAYSSSSVTA